MELYLELAVSVIIFAVLLVLWYFSRIMLSWTGRRGDSGVFTLISADGDGDSLEHTVQSLKMLNENGSLVSRVIIVDTGLSPDGRKLAELLARDNESLLSICKPSEVTEIIVRN
jgi:hypothetical protein